MASEWRFEEGDRKSDICSTESEYKNNFVKAKIDKCQKDTLYRLCNKADETIDLVVSGCSKLSQKEYKRRHDNLGKIVH